MPLYQTIDDGPWIIYTPTVTAGTGTITTLGACTASYKVFGKTVFWRADVAITTNGTAAGSVNVSLPPGFTVKSPPAVGCGRESASTGAMLQCLITGGATTASINTTSSGYPGGDGRRCLVSIVYEIA